MVPSRNSLTYTSSSSLLFLSWLSPSLSLPSAPLQPPSPYARCILHLTGPSSRPYRLPLRAVIMSKFRSQRKKTSRSLASERPWQADTPFGPPHIPSSRGNGINRIRNTLNKLSPAARAERELLKQKSRYKNPLTERNVNALVSEQEIMDACYPTEHSMELQVTTWLERLY